MALKDDIQEQWNRIQGLTFNALAKAANNWNFDLKYILGVASRETNCQNVIGDHGHGFGIMQIDIGSFPEWCASNAWKDVSQAADKGCEVLRGKVKSIIALQGKRMISRHGEYTCPANLSDDDIIHYAIAAYNCGEGNAMYGGSQGNVDLCTAHGTYSADVLARAEIFQGLIEKANGNS